MLAAAALTGLRMKNIVMAPTSGMLPIRGSRITRSFPCSYERQKAETPLEQGRSALSDYLLSYLDSFHSGLAEVLFDFHIYFHIPRVAASRREAIN